MTDTPPMQRIALAPDYEISRVIRGGWQMASGHGARQDADPVADMVAFADSGITTFDCADIYTGVEDLIGRFRLHYRDVRGQAALDRIKVHTKFVPNLDILPVITKADVEAVIDRSLRRLSVERLDLVQFHWWDYAQPRWLETAHWLNELRMEGKIDKVSGTNFDTDHMLQMVDSSIPLTSMQVQYSLLDMRPATRMANAAMVNGVWLLCYGTVAGGFLGDAWLGKPQPFDALENRSLVKYRVIIEDFGSWELFQALLLTLRNIADRYGVDIATVASAAVLARPAVAAVIVGARNATHLASNLAIASVTLTDSDLTEIAAVLSSAKEMEGDVYTLERDRTSRHGAIMKYNLNNSAA